MREKEWIAIEQLSDVFRGLRKGYFRRSRQMIHEAFQDWCVDCKQHLQRGEVVLRGEYEHHDGNCLSGYP